MLDDLWTTTDLLGRILILTPVPLHPFPVNRQPRRIVYLSMNPNAPLPAIPDSLRHSGAADFVAFRVLGEPLPCLCPACRDRAAALEREQINCTTIADTLPPAFWTRQAARLLSIERCPSPRWKWALVPAAGLLLASALIVLPARSGRAPDDFEVRWAEVQEALERPALGDLEACAVLLDEGENTLSEESL